MSSERQRKSSQIAGTIWPLTEPKQEINSTPSSSHRTLVEVSAHSAPMSLLLHRRLAPILPRAPLGNPQPQPLDNLHSRQLLALVGLALDNLPSRLRLRHLVNPLRLANLHNQLHLLDSLLRSANLRLDNPHSLHRASVVLHSPRPLLASPLNQRPHSDSRLNPQASDSSHNQHLLLAGHQRSAQQHLARQHKQLRLLVKVQASNQAHLGQVRLQPLGRAPLEPDNLPSDRRRNQHQLLVSLHNQPLRSVSSHSPLQPLANHHNPPPALASPRNLHLPLDNHHSRRRPLASPQLPHLLSENPVLLARQLQVQAGPPLASLHSLRRHLDKHLSLPSTPALAQHRHKQTRLALDQTIINLKTSQRTPRMKRRPLAIHSVNHPR